MAYIKFENQDFTKKQVMTLATDAYRGISSDKKYSGDERREGMNRLLAELGKDFRRNKITIFEIIEQTMAQELPKRLNDSIGRFAEVKTFDDGETMKFVLKNGKIKAVTIALGSSSKRQRVDNRTVTIDVVAIQAKVYDTISRIRSGQADFVELMDDAMEAVEDELYKNVASAMKGAYGSMPTANVHTAATLEASEFDKLINIVKAYGSPVIYGTFRGLASLPVDNSDASKNDVREKGYVGKYKGVDVIEIANSFEDEENTIPVIDDQYIYVIPAGKDKLVKVGLEGSPYVQDKEGEDWTQNFTFMQQSGVAILTHNNFAIYKNSSL